MNNNEKCEVLAPVGYFDMLEAAVRCSADACYFGCVEFSARRNAQNFTKDEMVTAIKYCHIRGVKAYLTLNILIKDSEMEDAFNLAKFAFNNGIDGIIIEDIGLARILHEKIPDLPLHASTQMSIHSPSALKYLKELGFKQVVVAREMSLEDLKIFCNEAKKLDIAVEVFVHGALCMCMSGQCLMSAFLGSRSGNRGLCAGPCRLPFKVKNGTGYDLSLKDLSLLDYVKTLREIGVFSFKIEGRMKRPEYVAAATTALRQALDNGFVDDGINDILKGVFSRSGFTDGYYQNKLGVNMFGIRTKEDVCSADFVFPTLHGLYRNERHSVPINIDINIKENKEIKLYLDDGKNSITVYGDIPTKALKKAIDKNSVRDNISKLGSTPYYIKNINLDVDDGLFVRASELNELRRKGTEELDQKRSMVLHQKSDFVYTKDPNTVKNVTPLIYARIENKNQIPDNIDLIDGLIIPLELNPSDFSNIFVTKIIDIPRGILSEKIIKDRLNLFKENGFHKALCGNLSVFKIAKEMGFEIIADSGMNIYNSESAKTAQQFGANSIVTSEEMTALEIEELNSPINKGIIAYGNIPLMLFKNCPLKNGIKCSECDKNGTIIDRKGIEFKVRCRMGYSELLNSVPIYMADKLKDFKTLDFVILYFSYEEKNQVEKVIEQFKNREASDDKYTRGLYYRGTI